MRSEGRTMTALASLPFDVESSSTARATIPPAINAPTSPPAMPPISAARHPRLRVRRRGSGGGTGGGDAGAAAPLGGVALGGPTGADAANPPQSYGAVRTDDASGVGRVGSSNTLRSIATLPEPDGTRRTISVRLREPDHRSAPLNRRPTSPLTLAEALGCTWTT